MRKSFIVCNILLLAFMFSLFSCKGDEDALPESVIVEESKILISLEWSVEGVEKPLEHTDLDLGIFKESNDDLIDESLFSGNFEELELTKSATDQNYLLKVRRYEMADDKDVDFTLTVSNSSGGDMKVFTGSFSAEDEASVLSWDKGAVKTVAKIEKSGEEFNVVNP